MRRSEMPLIFDDPLLPALKLAHFPVSQSHFDEEESASSGEGPEHEATKTRPAWKSIPTPFTFHSANLIPLFTAMQEAEGSGSGGVNRAKLQKKSSKAEVRRPVQRESRLLSHLLKRFGGANCDR